MDGGKITSQELYSISIFSWLGGRRLLYLPCEIGFVQICFEGLRLGEGSTLGYFEKKREEESFS